MRRAIASLSLAALAAAGCGLDHAETPPPSGPLPTPLVSLPPALAGARAAIDAALASRLGLALQDAPEGYRPAEPPALLYAPRTVAKVRLPNDPNRLYVVFYAFPDPAAAREAGRRAAAFYASGPALVQFPADARFSLRMVGEVLIFTAWSPGSTADRPGAEAAFELILGFGEAIAVTP
jgi:hypothetical protein